MTTGDLLALLLSHLVEGEKMPWLSGGFLQGVDLESV